MLTSEESSNKKLVCNAERLRLFRSEFCPISMINKDGSIHQPYFEAKPMGCEWTDLERMVLLKGIFEFGIYGIESKNGTDAWRKICKKWLPQRNFIELRIELAKMIGRQDLSIYKNVKFTNELEIQREYKKNKQLAKKEGKWKYGMYLNDVTLEMLEKIENKRKIQSKMMQENETESLNKKTKKRKINNKLEKDGKVQRKFKSKSKAKSKAKKKEENKDESENESENDNDIDNDIDVNINNKSFSKRKKVSSDKMIKNQPKINALLKQMANKDLKNDKNKQNANENRNENSNKNGNEEEEEEDNDILIDID